jgi:hypothetical protein
MADVGRRGENEAEERLVTPASYVSLSQGAMGGTRARSFALTPNAWPDIPPLTTIPQLSHGSSWRGGRG